MQKTGHPLANSPPIPSRKSGRPPAHVLRLRRATTKLDWLREAKRQAEEAYAEARASGKSYVAARQFMAEAKKYTDEIDALEKAETATSGPLGEVEFLAMLDERLAALPLPYLERAVTEYLRRHPGVQLVSPDA